MLRRWGRLIGILCGIGSVAACRTRDRLTFTSPGGNGVGPTAAITSPARDTIISIGDSLNVSGYAFDPDGVDSVWFSVQGLTFQIPPIFGNGGADTIFFEQHFTGSTFADTGRVTFFVTAVDFASDTGFTRSLTITVRP